MANNKRMSKSQFVAAVAETSGLGKKEASAALAAMNTIVTSELNRNGEITIPGLLKLVVVQKPAVPAGERRNPFTGEMKMYPAKPARKVVKARPIKALKDAV
jgi:nucleoid DNA-binding protein